MGAAGIVALEVLEQGGTQHPFALAVDEHDAPAVLFGVGAHGVVEDAELAQEDVRRGEAGNGVENGFGVEIDFDNGIAVERRGTGHGGSGGGTGMVALARGTVGVGGDFGGDESFFDGFGAHGDGLGGTVVLHKAAHKGGFVEEIGVAEGVELVELRAVDAQRDVEGEFERKGLVFLIRDELKGEALEVGEIVVGEFGEKDLAIGLDQAFAPQTVVGAVLREGDVADEEVGIVDEIGLKLGDTQLAGVGGHEGEVEIEAVGAFSLEGTGAEGDFAIGGIGVFVGKGVGFVDFVAFVFTIVCGEGGFDAGVGFAVGGFATSASAGGGVVGVDLLAAATGGGFALEVVGVGVYHDDFVAEGGHFKSVFVGDEDEVFALKSGDAASADRIEKANFVSDVHKMGMFASKGTKKTAGGAVRRKKSPRCHEDNGELCLSFRLV